MQTLKFGVFSDVHLDTQYDPNISNKAFCHVDIAHELAALGKVTKADQTALIGRHDCDSP